MKGGTLRLSLLAVFGLLLITACGVDGSAPLQPPVDIADELGPVSLYEAAGGEDDTRVSGTVEILDECVTLNERGHRRWILAWPASGTSWNTEDSTIMFDGEDVAPIGVRDQDRVTISGSESNAEQDVSWVVEPAPECPDGLLLLVAEIQDIVSTAVEGSQDSPIGGGLSSGTGSDVPLECPDGVEADTTEWFGPVGMTMAGAVEETFGDLVVGWIGEPFEIESRDNWSTWGLEDSDGKLVAVATLVMNGAGWDPSHARFCVIPRPEPPPEPFTLYVSNQSFDDDPVFLTIEIDGEIVIQQDFFVEGQHNWITFTPEVEPGEHTLTATSDTGVTMSFDFELPEGEPRWAALDYWYYPDEEPRMFTFFIDDEPIYFA